MPMQISSRKLLLASALFSASLIYTISAFGQAPLWNASTVSAGWLNASTGAFIAESGYATSDFIPVTPGATLNSSHGMILGAAGLCLYDAARMLQRCLAAGFANLQQSPASFIVPASPAPSFLRFTILQSDNSTEVVTLTSPPTPTPVPTPVPVPTPTPPPPSSTVLASALNGKNVMFWGDSISAIFGNRWQNAFIARTGAVYYGQDARVGRTWGSLLEGYGASCPLASLSALVGFDPMTRTDRQPQCGFPINGIEGNTYLPTPQAGYSLAQTLANVDLLMIQMGTNDVSRYNGDSQSIGTLGTITDGYAAGTEYGAINFALDAIYTAKPTIRVIIVTPYYFGGPGNRAAAIKPFVDAELEEGLSRGIPVLNMLANANINAINLSSQTIDGVHGTDTYFTTVMGEKAAQFAAQNY